MCPIIEPPALIVAGRGLTLLSARLTAPVATLLVDHVAQAGHVTELVCSPTH